MSANFRFQDGEVSATLIQDVKALKNLSEDQLEEVTMTLSRSSVHDGDGSAREDMPAVLVLVGHRDVCR